MMNKRIALATIALTALITGCGADPAGNPATDSGTGNYGVSDVNVHGTMVTCVRWKSGYAGGLSCDFTHPH